MALATALSWHDDIRVTVYGDPADVGVISHLGPRFMWASEALERRWPEFAKLERDTVRVTWRSGERRGYHLKSRGAPSDHAPCEGRDQFQVYRGMYSAGAKLAFGDVVPVPADVAVIRRRVISATPLALGGFVVYDGDREIAYDALATSLPPATWRRIMPSPGSLQLLDFLPQRVSFLTTDEAPDGVDFSGYTGPILVYDGAPETHWHRASRSCDGGQWCYESRGTILSERWVSAATQIVGDKKPKYQPGVVPIGRQAEWDGELLVTTVAERIDEYVGKVLDAIESQV